MISTVSSELICVVLVGSAAGDKLCNAGENRQGFYGLVLQTPRRSYKKQSPGPRKMAQSVKCLPPKREELSLDHQLSQES